MFVIRAVLFSLRARWDHYRLAFVFQWLDKALLSIVAFIGNNRLALCILKQHIGTFQVVGLARRKMKACRVTERIDCGVNFGAQPTTTTPDSLFVWIPPFAPALC